MSQLDEGLPEPIDWNELRIHDQKIRDKEEQEYEEIYEEN